MTVTNEERVAGGGVNITFRLFQAPPPFPFSILLSLSPNQTWPVA